MKAVTYGGPRLQALFNELNQTEVDQEYQLLHDTGTFTLHLWSSRTTSNPKAFKLIKGPLLERLCKDRYGMTRIAHSFFLVYYKIKLDQTTILLIAYISADARIRTRTSMIATIFLDRQPSLSNGTITSSLSTTPRRLSRPARVEEKMVLVWEIAAVDSTAMITIYRTVHCELERASI